MLTCAHHAAMGCVLAREPQTPLRTYQHQVQRALQLLQAQLKTTGVGHGFEWVYQDSADRSSQVGTMVFRGRIVQIEKSGQNHDPLPEELVAAQPGNFPTLMCF